MLANLSNDLAGVMLQWLPLGDALKFQLVCRGTRRWFEHDSVIASLWARYGYVPCDLGPADKLACLKELCFSHPWSLCDRIIFIIDDSGSMCSRTGMGKVEVGEGVRSRWEYAQEVLRRLGQRMTAAGDLKAPPIKLSFLNREDLVEIQEGWCFELDKKISEGIFPSFAKVPYGPTPLLRSFTQCLKEASERSALYLFIDGLPNKPDKDITEMRERFTSLPEGKSPYVTFFKCSEQDRDVKWMDGFAELSPRVVSYSDFRDEGELSKGEYTVERHVDRLLNGVFRESLRK